MVVTCGETGWMQVVLLKIDSSKATQCSLTISVLSRLSFHATDITRVPTVEQALLCSGCPSVYPFPCHDVFLFGEGRRGVSGKY